MYSFTGCLKNLQLNGQWLPSMSESYGVTPCFEGPSEAGTYFSKEGGYVVLGTFSSPAPFNGKSLTLDLQFQPKCCFCEI